MSLSCNLPIFQSKVDIKIEYKMLSMLKDLNNHILQWYNNQVEHRPFNEKSIGLEDICYHSLLISSVAGEKIYLFNFISFMNFSTRCSASVK